jgi:DNA polymerase-3 subunit beta
MPGVIIPRKTVEEARRLADGNTELAVELSKTKFRVIVDSAILTSKLIDGQFPDYDRVVPKSNEKVVEFDRSEFERLVERVATVAGNDRNMKFSFGAGRLEASAKNAESVALAVDDIDVSYEGEPIETAFNARYLTDIIGRIDGTTVVLKLGDPGSPALFGDKDAGDALYILMPMRVSS